MCLTVLCQAVSASVNGGFFFNAFVPGVILGVE